MCVVVVEDSDGTPKQVQLMVLQERVQLARVDRAPEGLLEPIEVIRRSFDRCAAGCVSSLSVKSSEAFSSPDGSSIDDDRCEDREDAAHALNPRRPLCLCRGDVRNGLP